MTENPWMCQKTAAEYLGVSRWTMRNAVKERRIYPAAPRSSKKVWFRKLDLDRARREGRI